MVQVFRRTKKMHRVCCHERHIQRASQPRRLAQIRPAARREAVGFQVQRRAEYFLELRRAFLFCILCIRPFFGRVKCDQALAVRVQQFRRGWRGVKLHARHQFAQVAVARASGRQQQQRVALRRLALRPRWMGRIHRRFDHRSHQRLHARLFRRLVKGNRGVEPAGIRQRHRRHFHRIRSRHNFLR